MSLRNYDCETLGGVARIETHLGSVLSNPLADHSSLTLYGAFECREKWGCPARIITINHDGRLEQHWERCPVRRAWESSPHSW